MNFLARMLVLLVFLVMVGGCGDDDGSASTSDDDTTDDDDDDDDDDTTDDDDDDDDDDTTDDAPPLHAMALIPAGEFPMGCPSPFDDRCRSDYRLVFVESFSIDIYETTAKDYRRCEEDGACESVDDCVDVAAKNMPAQCISYYRAQDYCAWQGKRLPTSEEWEKAARGTAGGHDFPWGSTWEPTWANWCDGLDCDGAVDGYPEAAPVDAFPQNQSPYGIRNMCGNMLEWTTTPSPMFEGSFVVRGGSYEPPNGMGAPDHALLSWLVVGDAPEFDAPHFGVRCVMSAD